MSGSPVTAHLSDTPLLLTETVGGTRENRRPRSQRLAGLVFDLTAFATIVLFFA